MRNLRPFLSVHKWKSSNILSGGQNGHIAFFCSNIERAVFHLQQRGIAFNPESYEYDEKGCRVVYLAQEFGCFAIHLVRA